MTETEPSRLSSGTQTLSNEDAVALLHRMRSSPRAGVVHDCAMGPPAGQSAVEYEAVTADLMNSSSFLEEKPRAKAVKPTVFARF